MVDAAQSRRSEAVDRWFASHRDEADLLTLIALCETIEAADPRLRGEIKWNAPSYAITDHCATTGLVPKGGVRLVRHAGAVKRETPIDLRSAIEDPEGLLEWKDRDRAVVTFHSVEQVRAASPALARILATWVELTQ